MVTLSLSEVKTAVALDILIAPRERYRPFRWGRLTHRTRGVSP